MSTAVWVVIILMFIVGFAGMILPLLPGTLLVWGAVFLYGYSDGFTAVSPFSFFVITIIAIVTGTADLWLPLLGAKTVGASWQALLAGIAGALIGTFVIPIPVIGTIVGYAGGLLLMEYNKQGDWNLAIKTTMGGLAGVGIATAVKLGGGLLILFIFLWQVMGG